MKAKVLLAGIAAAALVVVLTRIPGDEAPASPPNPVRVALSEVKDRPEMASYRVFEDPAQGEVLPFRGANYSAKVGAEGLSFEAGGHRLSLRARRVEQGGAAVDLAGAAPERTGFGSVSIPRGEGISEQFVFENRRTEHLVRIERPLGEGALTVKVAVGGSLGGPVQEVRRGNGAWTDLALENGGLVFTDASGKPGMTYTDAVAIDAKGRKQYFDPRWENGEIALEVPATFLRDAEYPILIDPWLQLDGSGSGGGISGTGTVSETPAIVDEGGGLMVAWSDASSGNFDIYLRYWNGFAWTALGTSAATGGVSNNAGTSTNPSIGFFTPTNTGFFHAYLAWEDDTEGSINIYARFWTGTDWAELDGSATSSGVSKRIGALCRNPQAVKVKGLVDNAPTSTAGDRTEWFPCIIWEEEGVGIASRFFYPGDDRFQSPPARWYNHPSGFLGSEYLVVDGTAARPSAVKIAFNSLAPAGNNDLAVAFEASTGTEYDIFVAATSLGAAPVVVAAVTHLPGPANAFAPVGSGNVCTDVGAPAGLSIQPSLATDLAGNLWVAWQQTVAGEREIYAATSPVLAGGWLDAGGSATGGGVSRTAVAGRLTTSSFPSIAFGSAPVVAWEDDAGTNPEIYVRRLNGASWDQVADEGSAMLVLPETVGNNGGISRTSSFSLRPRAIASSTGSISVAWRDGGETGDFDLLLRRYYDNEPRNLAQLDLATGTPVPVVVGGTVASASNLVQFTSVLFAESATLPVLLRLQLEIRPNTSVFTGQPTHESLEVAGGGTATILFTGLPNVNYHWRARTLDALGRGSPWIPFGGNADGDVDFRVDAVGGPSNTATGGQSKDKCGLLGVEVLLGLGLAALLRRRRTGRS